MAKKSSAKKLTDFWKFVKVDPLLFINNLIDEFQKGKDHWEQSFIIEQDFYSIEIPECELDEVKSKHFLNKFHAFTDDGYRVPISKKTKNIQSLFPLKDKKYYKSCVFYKADFSCGLHYIRNAEVRWNEHKNPTKLLELLKLFQSNLDHWFTWSIISNCKVKQIIYDMINFYFKLSKTLIPL